ncbi:MAG: NAD-glutamate dehydrogenase [Wolbachia endosymbiont of Fragariocoptes setiger]|nr:NAD-glutamate dehydrogenase [Wolbachia endosymbiont of Fragariocoptes setiger]
MCVDYNISTKVVQSLSNLTDQEKLKQFIKYFYNFVYNSNLKLNDKFLLYIAKDAYDFILNKKKKQSKLGICNTSSITGLDGKFTIIKIANDDMPFLVDSIFATIKSHNLTICYYSNSIINVKRKDDLIEKICIPEEENGSIKESLIYIIIKGISEDFVNILTESLQETLKAVVHSVQDWKSMLQKLNEISEGTKTDFFNWLKNNNFVFLGYQECAMDAEGKPISNRQENLGLMKIYKECNILSENLDSLYIIRSDLISIVHRRTYMNCIGVKQYSDQKKIVGEKRFFGLFTSIAEAQDVRTIPIVKTKVQIVEKRTGFVAGGHNDKALIAILQAFSCDELFQSNEDDLFRICTAIMSLTIKPRLKLFVKHLVDSVICIVLIPMRYASEKLMLKICDILKDEINAIHSNVCNNHIINEYDLMKLNIVLRGNNLNTSDDEVLRIEDKLRNITEKWEDRFIENLYNTFNTVDDIFIRYCNLFPVSYQENFKPQDAYYDIKKIEIVRKKGTTEVNLQLVNLNYQLKVYTSSNGGAELSQILKITKNLGTKILSHNGYYIAVGDGVWIHHFVLSKVEELVNNIVLKEQFEITLTKVFRGEIKNDYFNSLVILAGLKWKEVLLIRAFSAYLKQISFSYNQEYIQKVLSEHPKIVKYLTQLFHSRFNYEIDVDRVQTTNIFQEKIEDLLKEIGNVAHDYVLRSIYNLIMSIIRTSYYQSDKSYLSIKFDSSKIENLPEPRPYRELYVYSNTFEGIHLRGGKLARGGLRWSDRTEDFRTEVLGLMKAQMTKNAVIVPVGAKGGFVLKHSYKDMNTLREKGIECYKSFIRGMLDITDNLVNGKVISPKNVIKYDDDDPYLVVAADKGTATFSDYANQIATEYNFWLGDAFASGGSSGYDHKKMGITARGAWIAAERHFWKMHKDIYQDVSVVGIGDMSGDLFGNGMLFSNRIHLIGSFNHLHIFVDPYPNAQTSFEERTRLFELPFSTWMDYKKESLSQGGGIFERSSKSLNISQEIKKRFGITEDILSPNELIKYLLKAKVDLIWNGGIGTFVKATSESHSVVGDKANDVLRVNGKDIKASMFIEGGNLGCTQLGRIEYAHKGGYINADFVDNSAGVTCSDLEVNIKIALVEALKQKVISLEKRNEILSSMVDEVAFKVLNGHNKIETKALLLECMQAKNRLEQHHRLLLNLEKSGLLNRNIEFLPSDEEIMKMLQGLNSPHLSVLMSYARTNIKNNIINSDLLKEDSFFNDYLLNYFPHKIANEFKDYVLKHQLRREVIATCIANEIVNRMGCTFINNLVENTGIKVYYAANLYIVISRLYNLNELWKEVDRLDGVVEVDIYLEIVRSIQKFVGRISFWIIRNFTKFGFRELNELISLRDEIEMMKVDQCLLNSNNHDIKVEKDLGNKISNLNGMTYVLDVVLVSKQVSLPVTDVAKIYFELRSLLKFDLIKNAALQIKNIFSYWERCAINATLDDLSDCHYTLTIKIMKSYNMINAWSHDYQEHIKLYNDFLNEMITSQLDLSKLISIISRIRFLFYQENV